MSRSPESARLAEFPDPSLSRIAPNGTAALPWRQRPKVLVLRDPMSGFLHFVGALLSVAALALLVTRASLRATPWHIVSYAIFGAGMIGLYTASTVYHWFENPAAPSKRLRVFDHVMIYILIAATYTPICLVPLRGPWGWSLFGVVWGLALAGTALELLRRDIPRWIGAAIYIAMGWTCVVAFVPILRTMQSGAVTWMLIGGACYTVGGVIYALRRPNLIKDVFSHHEIFHLLCMAGSFSFFWVMYAYVIRLN